MADDDLLTPSASAGENASGPFVPPTLPEPAPPPLEKGVEFPPWLLNTGFVTALVLAGACLLASGYYLHEFQSATQDSVLKVINGKAIPQAGVFQLALMAQMFLARVQLLSCGIFVGMAFGFLGFALFLLGVRGQMNAEGSGAGLTVKVLSLSPGVFVLLCSTILIGLCATRTLPFGYDQEGTRASQPTVPPVAQDSIPKPGILPPDSTE